MKKVLIVAHYSRFLVQFELNDVKLLQGMGYEVHYATNFEHEDMYADAVQVIREHGVILHQVDFVRSPYNISANIKAYKQLKHLMQTEMFAGVHCHTPMAGALARLAANAAHTAPVLYTAHGFHFYKGCPLKNRLIYQTAETFWPAIPMPRSPSIRRITLPHRNSPCVARRTMYPESAWM